MDSALKSSPTPTYNYTVQLQRMGRFIKLYCCLLLPLIQVSNGVNLCGSLSSWPVPESPKDTTLKQVISVIRFVNLINYVIIIIISYVYNYIYNIYIIMNEVYNHRAKGQ